MNGIAPRHGRRLPAFAVTIGHLASDLLVAAEPGTGGIDLVDAVWTLSADDDAAPVLSGKRTANFVRPIRAFGPS